MRHIWTGRTSEFNHRARRECWPFVALCALLVAGCATGANHTGTTPPTLAQSTLAMFSGWRVAFAASDGRLHLAPLTGQTEIVGNALPGLAASVTSSVESVGASPDGHAVTYFVGSTIVVLTLPDQRVRTVENIQYPGQIRWSPDSAHLAYDLDAASDVGVIDVRSGQQTSVPTAGINHPAVLGWQDAKTLVVESTDSADSAVTLDTVNITTYQVRQITRIAVSPRNANFEVLIAPDGSEGLLYSWKFQSNPFVPLVERIDLTSGQITPLPGITAATGANWDMLALGWQQGGHKLAVTQLVSSTSKTRTTWLLDVAEDSARVVATAGYPLGISPDGNSLVLGSTNMSALGDPPHTLGVISLSAGGLTTVPLTSAAATFTFLGFLDEH